MSANTETMSPADFSIPKRRKYDTDSATDQPRGGCCAASRVDGWNECVESTRTAVAALIEREAALAERVKALEAKAENWQTLDRPLLKVFYMAGDDPFVFAAHGRIAGVIEDVEKDLRENPPACFEENGNGDYTFRANYYAGQYGEYGRCEFPAGWELDLLKFEPLEDGLTEARNV